MKIRKIFRKAAAFALAAVTALSAVPATTAFAAGDIGTISFTHTYDGAGNAMRYNSSANIGGHTAGGTGEYKYRMYVDGETAFCLQPGVPLKTGNTLAKASSNTWNALSADQKKAVGLALLYGYQGNSGNLSGSDDEKWLATQTLVWEFVTGCRNATSPYSQTSTTVYSLHFGSNYANSGARAAYDQIVSMLTRHSTIPSFMSAGKKEITKELAYKDGKYSLTLTDSNGVLSEYSFTSSDSNVKVSKSGNKLTITSAKAIDGKARITATRNNTPTVSSGAKMIAYGDPNLQDVITGVENVETMMAYINVETPTGTVALKKTSEDGVVSGISFTIKGDGFNKTVKTDKNGNITVEGLFPGTYTVTEQSIDRYEPQKTQTVTIIGGKTSTVTFSNTLKRGSLEVVKTSEDNLVEGVKFHLYGTSLSGLAVDEYAVTNAKGVAKFENVLISGSTPYTLEEVDTAVRYVVPASQTAPIEWKKVTKRSFHNVLKKFNVTVVKTDVETGKKPQGDASLAGAVYGIYKGEELADTYTTDENGQFTTKYYTCGNDWSIREITPSEGYLLDTTVHHVGAEPELYTVEYNSAKNDVNEQVIKGNIAIIKHTDNGETQIETPEEGAVFEVYLKSAGSFDAAEETERDTLICDENGFAQTKDMPYGIYTVHQTSGWDGRELMKDFDVFICKDSQTYRYLINNANFESYIKIVKKDIETGKVIPYAGAGFQIYDPDGNLVTMTFTYPEVTKIDTFYTTADGELITPQTLEYGKGYSLVEVQAPYGYVLDSEPVYFDVEQENSEEESGITVVKVERSNVAQKGKITVEKSGEVFSRVSGNKGLYQPIFAVESLEGAVYEITATEDIITTDGTVRAEKGEVVDTITTGEDGTAESKELYLGKYEVKEVTAPYGMVLSEEVHAVELVYAGQEIKVTEAGTDFYNERQRVEIDVIKSLEVDEAYGVGNNGEIKDVTFGLYAAEELTAADGSSIPADELIEVIFLDENGHGKAVSDLPMGSYYVQEISTNAAYLISDEKYPVDFEYAGQETAVVTITANEGEAIENELIYGSVSGKKSNEDGEDLGGALIGIFQTGTTEYTKEIAIATATSEDDGSFSFAGLLHEAVQRVNGEIPEIENEVDRISDGQEKSISADPNVRNFSFALVDGRVYFRENNTMTLAKVSMTAENRIKGLLQIRDCVRKLIQYQTDDYPEEMIQTEQENLNRLYDAFTKKYGLINSRGNYLAFAADESYFLLCSLEVLDDEGKFKRKADMFSKRTIKPHREVTFVETASEALALSIGEKACVDLPYMARLTGRTQEEIINDLQGVIFKVPSSEPARYVTADEYLSGNVRAKLITAKAAAHDSPEYEINVAALEKVIPKDLPASEISVRLGTTWIPQEDIQQFMVELLTPSSYAEGRLKVRYTPMNGDWFIENKSSDVGNVKADSTYGTKRANAYRIMEDTLNLRDTRIFDYVYDEHNNKKAVLNHKETTAAQAKQEVIKQAFQDWIWKDPERRNRLVRYYNDTFNSIRPREYDGSHITFGGISPEIKLRPHQVNAIARILYGGNTLLAHKVGAGKTFEMVAAAQESKRLGLCQKSMFVVPNHLVGQWASEYLRLYPSANILVTTKRDFETGNRKKFCGRIATGAYDAVIIGHSQFEKIPISEERQREQLMRQLDDIERGIDDIKASHGEQFTVKQLMKTRKAIKAKLDKLNDTKRKDSVINFEELGIDRLFIDESHFYKNLYLFTKMRNVGGIAQTEAQKSSDLFMKCRYLDEITGNRGVVFATGTPISNSMVEMYSVQRYLQYDTLVRNGLQHFDSWASTFGETVTALELSPEGTNYRAKTRFAKFYNLPELMQMFREIADIQTADMLKLPVPKVNYHNIKTKPSDIQTKMVAGLAKRAEKIRARLVKPQFDNMLKVTNDGRQLALDQRLIDPMLPDDPNSKVNTCVDNMYRIWEEHADTKAAQLLFCDLSTPKNDGTFNVYDDMREKLIQRGIPAEQVRFIHEASTDAQKKELFAKVRSGEVRVLFGSTQKMGAGTNCQDRLIAIHNLDCPWKPSCLEQRQGRIERQGNMFPEVEVYRYVTEQTFDAYLYQLVEGKQKFISQIMTSKSPVRSAEDVDEVALSFAEVKMLATGDERFKEKMDLDMQVAKLKVLKQSYLSEHYDLEDRILKHYPQQIKDYEERITAYGNDAEIASQHKPQGEDKFCPMTLNGVTYKEKTDAGEMLLAICKENPLSQPTEIGSYRGFQMEIYYDTVNAHYCLNLCGMRKHKVELGADALGNLTRIENEIAKFPARLEAAKTRKEETTAQLETAKEEVKKPFAFENELKEKTERLNALNIELNLNEKDNAVIDDEPEQDGEPPEKKCTDRER